MSQYRQEPGIEDEDVLASIREAWKRHGQEVTGLSIEPTEFQTNFKRDEIDRYKTRGNVTGHIGKLVMTMMREVRLEVTTIPITQEDETEGEKLTACELNALFAFSLGRKGLKITSPTYFIHSFHFDYEHKGGGHNGHGAGQFYEFQTETGPVFIWRHEGQRD